MANCVCQVYTDLAAFHAAIELVADDKFLGAFIFRENGTQLEKIVLIRKT